MKMAIRNTNGWQDVVGVALALALASFACANGEAGGSGTGGKGPSAGSGGTGAGSGGNAAGSGGTGSGGGNGGSSGQLSLPVIVTTYYPNQGWFGDASVTPYFTVGSTIIRQSTSAAGPCAARQPTAFGNCLEVIYTPPAGLIQPAGIGPFVGVFLLTTLTTAHPELNPPQTVGAANWGDEPGKNISPGATQIAFQAAALTDGQQVSFKAGTANDAFSLPEFSVALTTNWTHYSMPIAGLFYGTSVAGAFAWILHDTLKPATFYLDGIVWE